VRFVLTPNAAKSIAMTTNVMIHATAAIMVPIRPPIAPPRAQILAMKARPHATGCNTNAFVSASALSELARLKVVWSISSMITAGLYPITLGKQKSWSVL
jgi:hypothetical protein